MPEPVDPTLADLGSMPTFLSEVAARFPGTAMLEPSAGGGFCFLEQVWHLADLEAEGFGVRIQRLLDSDRPTLPDFDGARIAHERRYRTLSLTAGLARFAEARALNLEILGRISDAEGDRVGRQEGVGEVRLADIPRMMAEHDASHREEIRELLGGAPHTNAPSLVA